jgi:type II secretory ATPase GspE/PulE/Tfp pilus assembly ATPase PilB-like protein
MRDPGRPQVPGDLIAGDLSRRAQLLSQFGGLGYIPHKSHEVQRSMASNPQTTTLTGLTGVARRLVSEGSLSEADARKASEASSKQRVSLIAYLIENGLADDDTPVVRFINKVLVDAIKRGASDIHFEPYETRIPRALAHGRHPAHGRQAAVKLSAAHRLAPEGDVALDIAERRVPQDGRIKLNLSKTKAIDFRVSTCPTLFGEKIVLRILDGSAAKMGIDKLGYEDEQKKLFLEAIEQALRHGAGDRPDRQRQDGVAVHRAEHPQHRRRNISTAEDPVEIRVPGINQVQQNVKPA